MKRPQLDRKSIPWAMVIVAILAYGLLIPWLGFYWDDWPFAWILHFQGPAELMRSFFSLDPLVSPFFFITSSILGESTLAWQIYALFIRTLISIGALWSFNQIWPKFPRQATWVAFFFLVFPGYGQQWVAFTHSNQEWISLGCFILSLGFTAKAARTGFPPKQTVFALVLQAIGLMTTEYFLGLEVLRPIIIWFVLAESKIFTHPRRQSWQVLKRWLTGYVEIWLVAGIGQFLFHRSPLYSGHSFNVEAPVNSTTGQFINNIFNEIVTTFSVVGFTSWTRNFALLFEPYASLTNWLILFLVIVSLVLVFLYLHSLDQVFKKDQSTTIWGKQAIFLGLIGILAGRGPSWLAGMPVSLKFDWDRLIIAMALGASLLVIGLIDWLIKPGHRKTLVISILLATSIGGQFHQANTYRRDWENQKNFFWQLSWRIPSMKPETAVITHELPLIYVSDFQLIAPLNWIYAPDLNSDKLPYSLLYTKSRLGGTSLPKLKPDLPMQFNYRSVTFTGSTSDVIVIHAPADGCLRVLDPLYATAETVPGMTPSLTDAIPLTNLTRIQDVQGQSQMPEQYFGSEDTNNWCYFFEKAELAKQLNNWDEVLRLYRKANKAGYAALQPVENLVFIEALALHQDTKPAIELSEKTIRQDARLCPAVLQTWNRVKQSSADHTSEFENFISTLEKSNDCQ